MTVELPSGWDVVYTSMPSALIGLTHWDSHTIFIDENLPQSVKDETLVHETFHVLRGDGLHCGMSPRDERIVQEETARRMITPEDIRDVLPWSTTRDGIAGLLAQRPAVVQTRVDVLTDEERASLDEYARAIE